MAKIRGYVESELVKNVRTVFPEMEGLSTSAVLDWALRTLLKREEGTT